MFKRVMAAVLTDLAKEKSLQPEAIAKAGGFRVDRLYEWQRGKSWPREESLEQIARGHQSSMPDLLRRFGLKLLHFAAAWTSQGVSEGMLELLAARPRHDTELVDRAKYKVRFDLEYLEAPPEVQEVLLELGESIYAHRVTLASLIDRFEKLVVLYQPDWMTAGPDDERYDGEPDDDDAAGPEDPGRYPWHE